MTAPRRPGKRPEIKFAPREVFEQLLEWSVIPTFDLVVELPEGDGVVLVRRTIAPYFLRTAGHFPACECSRVRGSTMSSTGSPKMSWAYGLMLTPSGSWDNTSGGSRPNTNARTSSGYVVRAFSGELRINPAHFSGHRIIKKAEEVPTSTGAMYRFYLSRYFDAG